MFIEVVIIVDYVSAYIYICICIRIVICGYTTQPNWVDPNPGSSDWLFLWPTIVDGEWGMDSSMAQQNNPTVNSTVTRQCSNWSVLYFWLLSWIYEVLASLKENCFSPCGPLRSKVPKVKPSSIDLWSGIVNVPPYWRLSRAWDFTQGTNWAMHQSEIHVWSGEGWVYIDTRVKIHNVKWLASSANRPLLEWFSLGAPYFWPCAKLG